MLSDVTAYFRSCYQSDNRSLTLQNFFSSKVEHPRMLSDADLISGSLPKVAVDSAWAHDTLKDLRIYTKEKALYCCSLFLLGYETGKKRRIGAPLYLHPAQISEKEGDYFVSINIHQPLINGAALRIMLSPGAEAYDQLIEQLPTGFIDFGVCGELQRLFSKTTPQLTTQELLLFPRLYDKAAIKRAYKTLSEKGSFSLVPAAGLGVIRKSSTTLGVLSELKEIAAKDDFSPPLRSLLTRSAPSPDFPGERDIQLPLTLSHAQEKVFRTSDHYDQTLVIGPPGTGKSFTIAALAVDYLSQGKSVLIASSNHQAVDVIGDKIEYDFDLPNLVVRGGRPDYKRILKERLKHLLAGVGVEEIPPDTLRQYRKQIHSLTQTMARLAKKMTVAEQRELRQGAWLAQKRSGWLARRWEAYLRWRGARADAYHSLLSRWEHTQQQREQVIKQHLVLKFRHQLYTTLHAHRREFASFLQALRARTAQRKESLFAATNLAQLQKTFPIWLTSLSDINSVLPLEKGLFDLVIIDEATQCDIASALPVLQRGKRAVIVGDPQQLRHVSFLSEARQRRLQRQYRLSEAEWGTLNFRNRSLLDKVQDSIQDQSQVIFLDEHYRSAPSIIHFSNQTFYQGALRIMTATPRTEGQQRVIVHPCTGKRGKVGYNQTEADALLQKVDQLVREEAHQEAATCQSIGLLSPFREQVDYLQQQLQQRYELSTIERHRLLAGTAHSFQGEERDIMFISLVLCADDHPTALRYLNQPDVFNVSITRARSQQHIFTSLETAQLKPDSLVRKYLTSVNQSTETPTLPQSGRDSFLDEITKVLRGWGLTDIHRAYPIAGVEIDLLVSHAQGTYCLDAVGYPGDFAESFSLERYEILRRVGLTTFPVVYSRWQWQPAQATAELATFLQLR